jgi:hypothetical protein
MYLRKKKLKKKLGEDKIERIFPLFALLILSLNLIISFYLAINMIFELAEKLMKGK